MLNEIEKYVGENLFRAYPAGNQTRISSGIHMGGDGMPCRISFEEDKYCRLSTVNPFDEWMACALRDGWNSATEQIREIAGHFGVQWDEREGCLFIRFRRNEMSITQAMIRLHTAMRIIGQMNHIVKQL